MRSVATLRSFATALVCFARLAFSRSGKIVLALRAPFRDGTTHFVFEPLAFLERLAALVPPPPIHQLTYHGVLASGASWRGAIVPTPASRRGLGACDPAAASRPCARYSWAELMQRVFAVDVLKCARCGSRRRWIAAITQQETIVRILERLALESVAPPPAPPLLELSWEGALDGERRGQTAWRVGALCPEVARWAQGGTEHGEHGHSRGHRNGAGASTGLATGRGGGRAGLRRPSESLILRCGRSPRTPRRPGPR
ncbi:MAG: transposase [Planctomycetes bacterium]|nr:transposase [Planctomycetota bacterium]